MPHLTLEHTANAQPDQNFADVFIKLHRVLSEVGGIKVDNCKSRSRQVDNAFIALGGDGLGFVHLNVRFMEGRSAPLKQKMGELMKGILLETFSAAETALDLQITVEIRDIRRDEYFKHPEGTLTAV